ncbi:Leucine carboxyl methyltransferase Cupin like domain [Trypanosoma vivax]|nr:hypothetical protein TRVL_00519 [Trypanosoma vivax]KAH8614190.1 Leucine carboxyl methyltransferase Cupin like domain [Trypanosoma vivax]
MGKDKNSVTTAGGSKASIDAAVQHTNDDSVISKRSAVYHGYFDDPYLRFFVRKLSKRSPLINRGYHLRMLVMTDLIEKCIRHLQTIGGNSHSSDSFQIVQVISLGAGYDTLAMRLKGQAAYTNVHFYELDFPAVMASKAEIVRAAPNGSFSADIVPEPQHELVKLHGTGYTVVGADLRDSSRNFVSCLSEASPQFSPELPTVLYAECVMQYMPSGSAAELIRLIAKMFPRALFVGYDQVNPSDSFGTVMRSALHAKGSPLLGIVDAPDGTAMTSRALARGMCEARFANFHDLSRYYLTGEELRRVEALEPFDEREEWSEMCEHYGITMACTSSDVGMPSHVCFRTPIVDEGTNAVSSLVQMEGEQRRKGALITSVEKWPTGRFSFEGWGNGSVFAERLDCGDVLIVAFGGFTVSRNHRRTNAVHIHSLRNGECNVIHADGCVEPPALVFHSMSRIAPGMYVVFGGRTNPDAASGDAYLLTVDLPVDVHRGNRSHVVVTWLKLVQYGENGVLPRGRYRHAAIDIAGTGSAVEGERVKGNIFVFGGCAATGAFLNDAWLGSVHKESIHWKPLRLVGDVPPPCCSCAIIGVREGAAVFLSGGLLADGRCEGSFWFIDCLTGECKKRGDVMVPRFSHTMVRARVDGVERVILLGGSSCQPSRLREAEQVLLLGSETGERIGSSPLPLGCPTLTRHCCVAVEDGVVAVLGGGFTCFSFGTFAAKPLLLLFGNRCREHVKSYSWQATVADNASQATLSKMSRSITFDFRRAPVEELPLTSETFAKLVQCPTRPVVFRDVDMGSCVVSWKSRAYLKEMEGRTIVSVHVAHRTHLLDFVKKNFTFRHVPLADLLDHCGATQEKNKSDEDKEVWYLRSVASNMRNDRANFWRDFAGLRHDFSLPPAAASHIEERMHQACLRISAPPLQLWTHYDTLDNVLCQVVGRKRVVLFPPSEYQNLYVSGSSSAVLNIDAPDLEQFPRFLEASYHAMEVILGPGDMLFIPSLWFHHVTTLDGEHCISLNVFFERFPHDDYDKRDLYGNKDLPTAARLRERIVTAVQRLIAESSLEHTSDGKPLPSDFVEFALRQALQDLRATADNMAAARR